MYNKFLLSQMKVNLKKNILNHIVSNIEKHIALLKYSAVIELLLLEFFSVAFTRQTLSLPARMLRAGFCPHKISKTTYQKLM